MTKYMFHCIAAWMLTTASALASTNVSCRIDDAFLSFELEAIAGRAGPITQVQTGIISVKPAAATLTTRLTFDRGNIVQQWDYGGDMRLQIETGNDAAKEYVNLVILARLNGKTGKYSGRYMLKITYAGGAKELRGRIKECVAG
jgi:hypothetical protein